MAGLPEKIAAAKEEAAQRRYIGQAGGGLVEVEATGALEVIRVTVGDTVQVQTPDDRDMLEDLLRAATNDAMRLARAGLKEQMAGLTGGLPIPPGLLGF